jgi:hypothetical protein
MDAHLTFLMYLNLFMTQAKAADACLLPNQNHMQLNQQG